MPSSAARQEEPPTYLAQRVEGGKALPEVGTWLGMGRRGGGEELLREAVVRHVVESARGELFRELMEEVVGM
jgi:hypothetical protein